MDEVEAQGQSQCRPLSECACLGVGEKSVCGKMCVYLHIAFLCLCFGMVVFHGGQSNILQ